MPTFKDVPPLGLDRALATDAFVAVDRTDDRDIDLGLALSSSKGAMIDLELCDRVEIMDADLGVFGVFGVVGLDTVVSLVLRGIFAVEAREVVELALLRVIVALLVAATASLRVSGALVKLNGGGLLASERADLGDPSLIDALETLDVEARELVEGRRTERGC